MFYRDNNSCQNVFRHQNEDKSHRCINRFLSYDTPVKSTKKVSFRTMRSQTTVMGMGRNEAAELWRMISNMPVGKPYFAGEGKY